MYPIDRRLYLRRQSLAGRRGAIPERGVREPGARAITNPSKARSRRHDVRIEKGDFMTTDIHGATTPNAAGADPATQMLTPEEAVAQLRAIRERIPEYLQFTATEALPLRSAASVSRDFVMTAIHATGCRTW